MSTNEIILVSSFLVGVLQQYEGIKILYLTKNKTALDLWVTLIEFIWFFVALYMLFDDGITTLERYLFGSYVAYNIFGWLLGSYFLMFRGMKDIKEYYTLRWIYYLGVIFGLYFAIFSLFTLVNIA